MVNVDLCFRLRRLSCSHLCRHRGQCLRREHCLASPSTVSSRRQRLRGRLGALRRGHGLAEISKHPWPFGLRRRSRTSLVLFLFASVLSRTRSFAKAPSPPGLRNANVARPSAVGGSATRQRRCASLVLCLFITLACSWPVEMLSLFLFFLSISSTTEGSWLRLPNQHNQC